MASSPTVMGEQWYATYESATHMVNYVHTYVIYCQIVDYAFKY